MGKKKRLRKNKACGALPHTTGLTKEQYFEKLEELGLDYRDSILYGQDYSFSMSSFEGAAACCGEIGKMRFSVYGYTGEYGYIIPKEVIHNTEVRPNKNEIWTVINLMIGVNSFLPNVDEKKERHRFIALIEGDDGQYYMYGDTYSEGSGTSAA